MTRHRVLLAAALALPVVAWAGWAGFVRWFDEPVQYGRLVGRTEGQVRASYGPPDTDWQGYQSLALYVPEVLPPGAIRTLIFHPRGLLHPESGTYWVWLAERDGVWVCFQSTWFADGVRF